MCSAPAALNKYDDTPSAAAPPSLLVAGLFSFLLCLSLSLSLIFLNLVPMPSAHLGFPFSSSSLFFGLHFQCFSLCSNGCQLDPVDSLQLIPVVSGFGFFPSRLFVFTIAECYQIYLPWAKSHLKNSPPPWEETVFTGLAHSGILSPAVLSPVLLGARPASRPPSPSWDLQDHHSRPLCLLTHLGKDKLLIHASVLSFFLLEAGLCTEPRLPVRWESPVCAALTQGHLWPGHVNQLGFAYRYNPRPPASSLSVSKKDIFVFSFIHCFLSPSSSEPKGEKERSYLLRAPQRLPWCWQWLRRSAKEWRGLWQTGETVYHPEGRVPAQL